MKHNLVIECGPASSDELRRQWQWIANGVADFNAEWFHDHPGEVEMPLPVYETPRKAGGVADQRVACAPVVRTRGKATCVEWAAYCCGAMRLAGEDCSVVLVEARSPKYDKPVPYSYHALVEVQPRDAQGRPAGEPVVHDVTAELPGYYDATMGHSDVPWWERLGHCCSDCALGRHGKSTPCTGCAQAGSAQHVCTIETMEEVFGPHMTGGHQ